MWQMEWPQRQRGTHAVVGVGTKGASLHAVGYTSLIGTNVESYGWDLSKLLLGITLVHNLARGECYHDSKHCKPWKYPLARGPEFVVPDKASCSVS